MNEQLSPQDVKKWVVKTVTWQRVVAAFTSVISLLALAPAQLGEISEIIPSRFKPLVLVVSMSATAILRILPHKEEESDNSGGDTINNYNTTNNYYFDRKD